MIEVDSAKIKTMSLEDLHNFIIDYPEEAKQHRVIVLDQLAATIAYAGQLWDMTTGTDPNKGQTLLGRGTANHRSMTYKCRKLAGYSYP